MLGLMESRLSENYLQKLILVMAVDTPEGLFVPVIKHAEAKSAEELTSND